MAPRIVLAGMLMAVVPMLGCGGGRDTPLDVARELLFRKQFDEALTKCDQFLEGAPDSLDAWLLRGEINQKRGEMDEALADYTRAIAVEPDNPEGYYYRGKLYGYLGDTDEQIVDERRARELDVQSRLAYSIDFTPTMPRSMASRDNFVEPSDDTSESDKQDLIPIVDMAGNDPLADFEGDEPRSAANVPTEQQQAADTPYKRWLAQKAAKERQVENLDLQVVPDGAPMDDRRSEADRDDEEEPGSLEGDDPVDPLPHTTRFGLQFGDPIPGAATGQRAVSTGIRSGDISTQPRGRFFLQPRGPIDGGSTIPQIAPLTTGISSRPRAPETPNDRGGWMRLPSPVPGSTPLMGPRRQPAGTAAAHWPPSGGAAGPTTALPGSTTPTTALPGSTTWPLTALPSGSTAAAPGSTWGVIPPATTGVRGGRK